MNARMREASAKRSACVRLALATATFWAGCANKQAPPAPPPPLVSVATVTRRDVPVYSEYSGTLEGYVNAEVRARVEGLLLRQTYTEGAPVKAGQQLFQIDPQPYEAAKLQAEGNLAQAKAALQKASADVERDTPLVEKQAVSKQDLDNAIAAKASAVGQVAAADGQLRTALLNLGYARVVAPIDGIAGIAQVRVGNLVGQGQPTLLATISNVDPIRLGWPLAERDYISLASRIAEFERARAEGAPMPADTPIFQLVLADGSVFPYKGRVELVASEVNAATGTLTVQALFRNPEGLLRSGQYGRVRIHEPIAHAIAIPGRAIAQIQGQDQVGVVQPDDKVALRPVKLGPKSGAFVVVREGLTEGERIVIDGMGKLRAGEAVKTKPADTSALPMETVPPPEKGSPPTIPPSPGVAAPQRPGGPPASHSAPDASAPAK